MSFHVGQRGPCWELSGQMTKLSDHYPSNLGSPYQSSKTFQVTRAKLNSNSLSPHWLSCHPGQSAVVVMGKKIPRNDRDGIQIFQNGCIENVSQFLS